MKNEKQDIHVKCSNAGVSQPCGICHVSILCYLVRYLQSERESGLCGVLRLRISTGNPGSVIVPQYGSIKITVFVWGKNIILKFLGNTK